MLKSLPSEVSGIEPPIKVMPCSAAACNGRHSHSLRIDVQVSRCPHPDCVTRQPQVLSMRICASRSHIHRRHAHLRQRLGRLRLSAINVFRINGEAIVRVWAVPHLRQHNQFCPMLCSLLHHPSPRSALRRATFGSASLQLAVNRVNSQ